MPTRDLDVPFIAPQRKVHRGAGNFSCGCGYRVCSCGTAAEGDYEDEENRCGSEVHVDKC